MSMERHGAELHYVRPDRVYRTSVLSPLPGYQPSPDVQAVARAFTNAGYNMGVFTIPTAGQATVSGYLGAPPLSFWQTLKLKLASKRAEKRARKMLKKLAQMGVRPSGGNVSGLHGVEPANQGMAQMAAQISVGMRPMPMPAGAQTRLQAGLQISPQITNQPHALAYEAVNTEPPYIAQRAGAYGYSHFTKPRSNWFDS